MKITRGTKWVEFAPFVNEERIALLRERITDSAIFDFWGLSIGEFSPMLNGGLPKELDAQIKRDGITVHEVIEITNAAEGFLKEFEKVLSSLELDSTADEKEAHSYMPDFAPIESMLIFTQKYFNLKSFGEAEKISVLEYLLAKKATYSDAIYQKAITRIQNRKRK